jgi:hypothetical protein
MDNSKGVPSTPSTTPPKSPADVATFAAASHVRRAQVVQPEPAYVIATPYLSPVGEGALTRLRAEFRPELAAAS